MAQFRFDFLHSLLKRRLRRHVMRIRIDPDLLKIIGLRAGKGIEFRNAFNLVAEKGNPPREVLQMRRPKIKDVSPDSEIAALEGLIVAPVLLGYQV